MRLTFWSCSLNFNTTQYWLMMIYRVMNNCQLWNQIVICPKLYRYWSKSDLYAPLLVYLDLARLAHQVSVSKNVIIVPWRQVKHVSVMSISDINLIVIYSVFDVDTMNMAAQWESLCRERWLFVFSTATVRFSFIFYMSRFWSGPSNPIPCYYN